MISRSPKILSVVFCDDIRDETGNKHSLMGVLGGDVLLQTFPAQLQFAVYFLYDPDEDDGDTLNLEFRLVGDDKEIVKGSMKADLIQKGKTATFIIPKGVLLVEKPMTLKIGISINGRPEEELLSKKIMLASSVL